MTPLPAPTRGDLRIGDAERDRAASELADHYAQGRLDGEEHAERLDRIWTARTRADLEPVFADLPGNATFATPSRPRPASRRRVARPPGPFLVLLVVLGAIAVLANLPLILVGLAVWFFVLRGGCGARRAYHR
jgi:ferric-dicitrate binding protein FerR (iron transport regulator)